MDSTALQFFIWVRAQFVFLSHKICQQLKKHFSHPDSPTINGFIPKSRTYKAVKPVSIIDGLFMYYSFCIVHSVALTRAIVIKYQCIRSIVHVSSIATPLMSIYTGEQANVCHVWHLQSSLQLINAFGQRHYCKPLI